MSESRLSCDMVRIPKEDRERFYEEGAPQGLFYWTTATREVDGIKYECRMLWAIYPDGSLGALPIRPVPTQLSDVNGGASWEWDGNEDKPTLTPSVHHVGRWHGYVRAGRMESC